MRSLAQIENAAEQYRTTLQRQDARHVTILPDKTIFHRLDGKDLIYVPTATGALFHRDNSFIRLIMGPFGSGKTTCAINEIVRRACAMPAWKSGRRASRWIIIRNTSGELYSTTLQSWLAWCGDMGDIKKRQKPLLTYEHTFNDGHGIIELELIFIALDRPEDVRKLKSFEATGAYMNELSEIPEIVLSHLPGRLNGRYPSNKFCPDPYWSGIIADTNPPDEDHYIYKKFETTPTESYKIFRQPPGLLFENGVLIKDDRGRYVQNPECDNYANMNADYYVKLAENQREGFIKVFCCGKYGVVESGKRVYPEYNDDLHSAPRLEAIQGLPIHLGWDFGLTPACIVIQITPRGQMRVLKEYQAEDMGIRTFAKNVVIPSLPIDFPYNKVGESEGDPAGEAGDAIMEELSCIGELNNLGIKTNAASSNDIDVRVGSVRYFLNMMIDGQPAFVLDREKCPGLRKGFVSGYHFKRMNVSGDDRYQEKPNKNTYSHRHDGLQYVSMKFASDRIIEKQQPKEVVNMYNPVMRLF